MAAVAGLLLIPAVVVAGFSGFLFDAPGSERSPLTWALGLGLLLTPLLLMLAISYAVRGVRTSDRKRILHAAFFVGFPLLYICGVSATIHVACDGQFVCP